MPLDLRWLPDGSGFVIALAEWREGRWAASNLYEFSLADRQLRQITAFTDELAGAFSIAPDGQWIVFERAPDFEQMTDLWLVRRDGSELRLLAESGARPAWSRVAPQAAPTYQLHLPALRR
jgi:Tol biopolymer transport system component